MHVQSVSNFEKAPSSTRCVRRGTLRVLTHQLPPHELPLFLGYVSISIVLLRGHQNHYAVRRFQSWRTSSKGNITVHV